MDVAKGGLGAMGREIHVPKGNGGRSSNLQKSMNSAFSMTLRQLVLVCPSVAISCDQANPPPATTQASLSLKQVKQVKPSLSLKQVKQVKPSARPANQLTAPHLN